MRISVSKIKAFKACRRAYQLRYVEGLVPVKKSDALEVGTSYHELLEFMYNNNGDIPVEPSKACAMTFAYKKYIYPNFKCKKAEKWLEKNLTDNVTFVGIADGIADDGSIVEHKTTSVDLMEYEYNLQWDEQLLAYMWLTGARKVYYTIIKKPTIRQKKNETDQEFFDRMVAWYDEDTQSKITMLEITKTDADIEQFEEELRSICMLMELTDSKHSINKNPYYRNTCHCTKWGSRCEYASVCLDYDPNEEYIEFTKRR